MSIQDLIKNEANVNITVNLRDLQEWHKGVIADTRRELEAAVISDKAETYPTPKQVSEILGVNLSTLWAWSKKGYLVPSEIGAKRRYKMSEVKALLEGRSK